VKLEAGCFENRLSSLKMSIFSGWYCSKHNLICNLKLGDRMISAHAILMPSYGIRCLIERIVLLDFIHRLVSQKIEE
jgi:hypothetical protein